MADALLSRLALPRIRRALGEAACVVLSGPRGSGKTTLCRVLEGPRNGESGGTPWRRYSSLADPKTRGALREDTALLAAGRPLTLEDVEYDRGALRRVFRAANGATGPGAFLLTSAAHLDLLPWRLPPSPTAVATVRVWPLTRREAEGGGPGLWPRLLESPDARWRSIVAQARSKPSRPLWPFGPEGDDWRPRVRAGGFPGARGIRRAADRRRWFSSYLTRFLTEDIERLSSVGSPAAVRRLLGAAALRLGQILNQTALGRATRTPQPTVRRHLRLLEAAGWLVLLPAWLEPTRKRLIRAPRTYWSDPGLAMHLADDPEPAEPHLQNLVLLDLLAWRDAAAERVQLFHWRTATDAEVDFVVETDLGVLPLAVTTRTEPGPEDIDRLQTFRRLYVELARPGLVLHTGSRTEWVADDILAAPWWRVA